MTNNLEIKTVKTTNDGYFYRGGSACMDMAFKHARIEKEMLYMYFHDIDTSELPGAKSSTSRRPVKIVPLNQCVIEAEEWAWDEEVK